MLFQVRYLVLFLLLSVRDSFKWFWMSLRKNIQLMLDFPKSQFLVLHFSCYTLMTFLMVLSVMLLSMLMILLSIPSVIRRLICSNNLKWLLNLILIYKILWTGARSDMLISMLGKVNWFGLTGLITLVLLLWKWMSLLLRKSHLLRCWGWPSLLNWIGALTTKTASNNIGALIRSMKFLSPEVSLVLYKSVIRQCVEYYCQVWTGAPSCFLELLFKLQKWICRTVGSLLAAFLEPLAHPQNVTSLGITFLDVLQTGSTSSTSVFLREVYSLFW